MKRFLKSLSLLLCSSLLAMTSWAAGEITEVIAINFASEKASLDTSSEELLGYVSTDGTRGGQVAQSKWNNVSDANSNGKINVKGAMTENIYALEEYSSPNTWESKEGSSTSIQKLTKGYLDVSNTGNGAVPRITLSGMPVFGYDVAVILSGDGGTFGSVSVNGINYIGDATNGTTIQGNASWGTRKGYDTLAEGQNVIYVAGLHEKTLTITGNCTTSSARASIAGLMVFFRETDETVRDFMTSTESWNEAEWGASFTGNAPTSGAVVLSSDVTDGTTLTMDALPTLDALTILGTTPVTITTENTATGKLSAGSTTINTDTTVEAGAASLGAVTVANDKTLTVEDNMNAINSITNNGTLRLTAASGHESAPVFDLTTRNALKNGSGKLLIAGENPTLVKLGQLGTGMKIEVESGTHTLRTNADSKVNPSSTIDSPTIWVKSGATLHLQSKDIIGWTGNFSSDCVIRNSGNLIWEDNPDVSGSDCYTGQWVLDNNAVLIIARTNTQSFAWRGGSESTPNVTLTSGNAEITRSNTSQLMIHKASTLYVKTGEASTDCLTISTPIGQSDGTGSLTKIGAGTLKLTGENTAQGTLTVSNGTLDLASTSNWAGPVTLASGATLAGTGTITGALTFNAGATINATDGAITASGTVTLPADGTVTVSGTLFGGNYILKTTSASADEAAKFVVADGYAVVADDVGYKVIKVVTLEAGATYTVTKPLEYTKIVAEGAITINIADVTLDQATVAPYLDVTGVTGEVTYTFSYIVDGVTYPCVFLGTEDALWDTTANWYSSYRKLGDESYPIQWTPKAGKIAIPGAAGSDEWDALLIDGNLIGDNIATVEGYKTVTMTDTQTDAMTEPNALEGWALKLNVRNNVHLKIAKLKKLQSANADNNEGRIYVDETSQLTISDIVQTSNVFGGDITILGKLIIEEDLSATGNSNTQACFNYTLGKTGQVQYAGLSNSRAHVIKNAILALGDSTLPGKGVKERKLLGFTSADANQTFSYEVSGISSVTNADVAGVVSEKTSVTELSEIGDYCFEKRNDGYYVVYMGYAETVELTAFTATVDADGITLSDALNGQVLSAKAALTIDFGENSGTFTFDNTEALNFSSITVTGTNGGTIVLDQTCAGIEYDALTLNTTVSADAAFYAANVGTISGSGKLCLSSGELTLTKANTYEGGTDIAEEATLTVPTNGLGSGAVTGAGKLVVNGYPANATVRSSLGEAEWTGTYVNTADNSMADTGDWFGSVGNEGSSVEFTGSSTGWLAPAGSADFALIVSGSITFNNGNSSDGGYTFNGPLSGTGTIATTGQQSDVLQFVAENNDFRGTVTVDGYHCVAFGEQADDNSQQGKIVINQQGVSIASGKTWTAVNGITITENGTLTISEARALPTDKTVSGAGALVINGTVDLSGITGALTCALTAAENATVTVSAEQLSTFAKVTVPEGATLKVKLTVDCLISGRLNCTLGAESTLDGAIVLDGIEDETTTFTDGVLSVTFAANPTLTGNAWWWDYEFNGTLDNSGTDTAESLTPRGTADSYTNDNQELYIQKSPWRDATFSNVDEFTAVMYCQPGAGDAYNNRPLIAFGTKTGVAVILATGANAADGDMQILLNRNNNITSLVDKLRVPTATTAKHLYAFTFAAQENKTVISVYVDGKLKKTTTVNERFHVTDGFQIGAVHGGQVGELVEYPQSGNLGTIDFLRVTKEILSADAMRALAEVYKYESANGEATRTIEGEEPITTTWVAESTWTQSGKDAPVNQPNNGTNVTLTANVATEVMVNLEEAVTYETVTVAGNAAVTFKKGTATFSAGDITIGTDVTIEYGAIDVDSLIVNGGKTLTFDFTDYDFNSIYASTTIPLTGLATLGENATVTVALPTLPAYLTAECVFDANKSEYALAITVTGTLAATIENNAITWKVGDTVVTPPADLTALDSITMTVVGNNSVALTEDMTMASVVLTGEGNAVTFESGKLTVTNTLTMDNVNVMATPDTLAAAVVMGTAGTETFTMHSQASYTHENAFAMRFENCALTKVGVGTFPIASSGFVLDSVNVTLANGALQLVIGSGVDPKIKDTTFTYVDANKDGVADGELTNHGWVHSMTTTTFVVPEGVTGKALVGSCLTDTGAVVKQGAGTLELGVMKTANAGPYTGATTIEVGTLVYDVTNNTADTFVMQSAITVKADAAIKGSANCTLASLILEDDAIIDATDSAVTATTVTLPKGEDTKVVLKKDASGDVLSYTGETPNMDLFTTATTLENKALGLGVKVDNGVVTLVLTQVSVPEVVIPDDATEEVRAELEKQQAEAEVAAQEVADALAASTEEETRTANVTAIENPGAASIIENAGVELTQNEGEETYTAKFTYDFGVSAINIVALDLDNSIEGAELYVVVKAELDDDYSFANGVTVTVTDGENAVEGAVAVNEAGTESDAPTGNTRYFRFPLPTVLGTHSYEVRASK